MKRLSILFLYSITVCLNHKLCQLQTFSVSQEVQNKIPDYLVFSHSPIWYCGFASVVADFYWLYLSHHVKELSTFEVYNFSDFITNLDPQFNVMYRFVAVYLMMQKQYALSFKLLQKSLTFSYNADDWRIYLYCAYTCFFYNHDSKKTAHFLHQATLQPSHFDQVLKQDRCAPPLFLAAWCERLRNEKSYNGALK